MEIKDKARNSSGKQSCCRTLPGKHHLEIVVLENFKHLIMLRTLDGDHTHTFPTTSALPGIYTDTPQNHTLTQDYYSQKGEQFHCCIQEAQN